MPQLRSATMTRFGNIVENHRCVSALARGHVGLALVTWLLLAPAAVRADWLDEMPSVDDVARTVRAQNQQDAADPNRFRPSDGYRSLNGLQSGPRRIGADDQEWYAARLAGTFELLRWLMLFEALRETNSDMPSEWWPLSAPNESTLQRAERIATEYRQVELALERGVGRRPGYHKRLCDAPDTFLNRLGRKMVTRQQCYFEQFKLSAEVVNPASYRQAIFPRLFCSQGQHYHDRFQAYYTNGIHGTLIAVGPLRLRGPDRPHNYAFKRIRYEQWPQVARQMTTEQVCSASGGDRDADGICDDWEAALQNPGTDVQAITQCALCPEPMHPSGALYPNWDAAVLAAKQVALAEAHRTGHEWGAYIYPVPGGYRYQTPVTSQKLGSLDVENDVQPAFNELFATKPASCKAVALYHTHPGERAPWNGGRLPGLSISDFHVAIRNDLPSYVIDGYSEDVCLFEPAKHVAAHEEILSVPAYEIDDDGNPVLREGLGASWDEYRLNDRYAPELQ